MGVSRNIAVLGAGNMGTAVAQILAEKGHRVVLWDHNPEIVRTIADTSENKRFLPGIRLSERITMKSRLAKALEDAEIAVVAVSSAYVRTTAHRLAATLGGKRPIIMHIAKGLESGTYRTMHEVIQEKLPPPFRRSVVTLSGPSIAKEFVREVPTAVVAASADIRAAKRVREVFESAHFKVALSRDVRGVGLCGALKNVYAIALGMCDGMRLTMNAKAFMFSVAVEEMRRALRAFGGDPETAHGLAGVGDLAVTGLGAGRNRAVGERICREGHCKFIFEENAEIAEGVHAAKVFTAFARTKRLEVPLAATVYRVLYQGVDPCPEVLRFFGEFRFMP